MSFPQKILAIDIGGGTQDILLYEEGKPIENCAQMILPSPTQLVAQKISWATSLKKNIFLNGNTMGGGACTWALENHLRAGLKVAATKLAALTFHDNLEVVQKKGIKITNVRPAGWPVITLGDVQISKLEKIFREYGLQLPENMAIAVQDHGFNPRGSNRLFRFRYWQRFILQGGNLKNLIYKKPPPFMTRMLAVKRDAPAAYLMDTCAAAIWGILCDPRVKEEQEKGFIAVNLGNQHTLGALVQGERIWGIFEHHTGRLAPEKIKSILKDFAAGELGHEKIMNDGGHGCFLSPYFPQKKKFSFVAVTGPQRNLVAGLKYYQAVPYGDMMLTGCFGLVAALKAIET
ncbi:MAG: DUF1786 domain-containing protein [Thermodesulfobacteriota bacterium]